MARARGRATTAVAAASIAAHVIVLAVLALHVPRLKVPPPQPGGPPEPIIPILLMPRAVPPSPATGERPAPIRLHRRPQRFAPGETPVAPLFVPEAEPAAETEEAARRAVRSGPPPEDPLAGNVRNALRSRRNCDDPALTRAEREACMDRMFAGGRGAPPLGLGIEEDKTKGFAAAAERKAQNRRYREANGGPGVTGMNDPSAPGRVIIPSTRPPPPDDRGSLRVPF